MANTALKFFHVATWPTEDLVTGGIYFNSAAKMIRVRTANAWEDYGGTVTDATYTGNVLTISKADGTSVQLDFNDVASATGTNAVLKALRSDMGAAKGAVKTAYAGTNYLSNAETLVAGDKALDTQVKTNADAISTNATAISNEVSRAEGVEGSLNNLTTTTKTNLVAAINEVDAHADTAQTSADTRLNTVSASGSNYITASFGEKSGDTGAKTQALSVSATVQSVANAGTAAKGLAEASDVKSYADARETAAKSYADAITVNGQTQSSQNITVAGKDIALTGYAKGSSSEAVAATDTVNAAIGKLENQIDAAVAGGLQAVEAGNGIAVTAVASNKQTVSAKVANSEKILAATADGLKTTLTIEYNSTDRKIYLKGISGTEVSSFDASAFVKDGMLWGQKVFKATAESQEVSITKGTETKTTTFTGLTVGNTYLAMCFSNGEATGTTYSWDKIDVTDLVDVYTAGDGLQLSAGKFSIKLDADGESYLTVGENGLKLSGVASAISTAKSEAISDVRGVSGDAWETKKTVYAAAKLANDEATRAAGVEGSLSSLTTEATTNLVAAINEVDANADAAQSTADAAQSTADAKVASVTKGTDGSYFTTTVDNTDAKNPKISGAIAVKAVADATAAGQGLADAYAAKNYADARETAAKSYADAITVNGQTQSNQAITIDGSNVNVDNTAATKVSVKSAIDALNAFKDRTAGFATSAQGSKADSALQGVQVNGADLTIDADKKVNVTIATGSVNGTIAVNGSNVAVKGLGSAAYTDSTAYDAAGAATTALASAKEYADNLMTWQTF